MKLAAKQLSDDCRRYMKWPELGRGTIEAAAKVLEKDGSSQRESAAHLEADFSEYMGVSYSLACNNGTAALHAALHGLALPRGSEVIVPTLTIWSSVMPLFWHGLCPVFCDVDPETLCIAPGEIERKISSKTSAIIVVHLFGQVAELEQILTLAEEHGLRVVEDASQAIGATYCGHRLGSLGDVSIFSFQSSKYLPCGEGGIMLTDQEDIFLRAMQMGHQRRLKKTSPHNQAFVPTGLGFKFRIHPVAAELARLLLPGLESLLEQVSENMKRLTSQLCQVEGVLIPSPKEHAVRSYWTRFHVWLDPQRFRVHPAELRRAALNAGAYTYEIPTPYGKGIHQAPIFTDCSIDTPWAHWEEIELPPPQRFSIAENLANQKLLTIPVFPTAPFLFIDEYAQAVVKVLRSHSQMKD